MQGFSKQNRLRSRYEFKKIQREGRRFQGNSLSFQWMMESHYPNRLGMTVPKRFGNAVKRNLLKRRIREVFRKEQESLLPKISVNVFPRHFQSIPSSFEILMDFRLLFTEIKRLSDHAES
ncbi:MAG: ribonuclease P protein component [Candidatus Rhabdochlamydia sp.]